LTIALLLVETMLENVLEDFCMLRALLLEEELEYDAATMSTNNVAFWQAVQANEDAVRLQ
jgi:hypothetical protein